MTSNIFIAKIVFPVEKYWVEKKQVFFVVVIVVVVVVVVVFAAVGCC